MYVYDWILIGSVVAFRVFVVDFKNWKCSYNNCLWLLITASAHTHINDRWKSCTAIFFQFFYCCVWNIMPLLLICWLFIALASRFQSIKKVYWVRPNNKETKKNWENETCRQANWRRASERKRERATKNHQQIQKEA